MTGKGLLDEIPTDDRIDRALLEFTALDRFGHCYVMNRYLDDMYYLKKVIDAFFVRNAIMISKLMDTNFFEYNPIHNYDRHEERGIEENQTGTEKTGAERGITGTNDNLHSVSAYNNAQMVGESKDDGTHSSKDLYSSDVVRTDKTTHGEKAYLYGNIGVTSSQQLIEEERRVVQFDIYVWICDRLEMEICTYVY